ncbi:hypothetical protein WPS_03420 [Vulcanimicrobium alpinum]|uniref:Uncharacterized protein n=1 Tax=Vulcanimicrobium alpinum TaxID=3016050 RepID=A0AAN2C8K0_UNVUL|nr:hypothetical protein WPS_03420 [Vulcanimicrobium alpinum]
MLGAYRRFRNDETFRAEHEHALYEMLVRYPELTRRGVTGVEEQLAGIDENASPPSSRTWNVGMTAPEEQAYCEWFASHLYLGAGAWIELGTFLGSLTIPSALGLAANPRRAVRNRRIRAFDLFQWDAVMTASVKGTPFEGRCTEGESYEDLYRATIADVADRVEVHQADLVWYRYDGEPIEFLMVDVMKHEYLVANVLGQFFGHVLPGIGHVFHQDYLHFYEGWITLSMYRLRDYFTPVCEVGAAVAFRCEEQPPNASLTFPLDSKKIDAAWIDEAFAWSRSVISEQHHHEVAATHVMTLVHANRLEDAARAYHAGAARYPGSYSFAWMTDYLKTDRNLVF